MLLNENQLLEWTGYKRRSDLMRFLRERHVDHWVTNGGSICTTLQAINEKLVEPADEFEFYGQEAGQSN